MAFLSREQLELMAFKSLGQHVRISDRAAIHDPEQIEIGDHSRIDDFCVISGRVTIGRNVHVAVFCNVAGGSEGVTFDDFSALAYGCHVFSQSEDYTGGTLTNPTIPAQYKNVTKRAVRIGRHCIVGTQSVILPGVILAEGGAVWAKSMVTRSTEEWWVYSGVPARRVMARKRDLLVLEAAYLERQATEGG